MNRKKIAALAVAGAVLAGVAVLAAGGTAGDPLITLGYLTGTYVPDVLAQVEARADKSFEEGYQKAADAMAQKQAELLAQIGSGGSATDGEWKSAPGFTPMTMLRGGVMQVPAGSGFLLLAGSATVTTGGGVLVDVTAGAELTAAQTLTPGRRYLAAEGTTVAVTALSDALLIAPQGYYKHEGGDPTATPFTDLVSSAWYYDYTYYVFEQGLFSGTGGTEFAPNLSMTRSMLAVVLHRLAGLPDGGQGAQFSDVAAGTWYTQAVHWAAGSGIVMGTGDGRYLPGQNITREQMAAMLCRYAAQWQGLETVPDGDMSMFSDTDRVSDWARDAVAWAVGRGIITGRDGGRLDPGGTVSRAEVAAMLARFSALLI